MNKILRKGLFAIFSKISTSKKSLTKTFLIAHDFAVSLWHKKEEKTN